MVSSVVTPGYRTTPTAPHQYGTRIRSNSVIKPSVRLRQVADTPPAPRRIKPVPVPKPKPVPVLAPAEPPHGDWPPFPPDHVMLHTDDLNSRVFLAIGRAFMSVDNRAMTIKDLAEMTLKFGLMCQNVSAAGQAITTYIRAHLQRCDVQQDHPLLLRHVMSGTPSDDDLVTALHSRVGGAHCTLSASDKRITNFRRGTMVWYLSRAAGAPCPFARAGIRLCDYTESGKVGCLPTTGREKKRERDRLRRAEQCGQKRKRLLRACADKGSDSDSTTSEEDKRPPKVKLTLRLRPLNAGASRSPSSTPPSVQLDSPFPSQPHEIIDLSKDDDMDTDTESSGESDSESDSSDSDSDAMSVQSSFQDHVHAFGDTSNAGVEPQNAIVSPHKAPPTNAHTSRSPSVPSSVVSASPPPDSADEDEELHGSMSRSLDHFLLDERGSSFYDDEDDYLSWDDSVFDLDGDAETQWESPGPRSPSAQFEDEVVVKQEPNDVGGLLDAWDLPGDMKVLDVVAQAAAGILPEQPRLKAEEAESWTFKHFDPNSDSFPPISIEDATPSIKQEEVESGVHFFSTGLMTPLNHAPISSSISPVSPALAPVVPCPSSNNATARASGDLEWRDAELLGPDSVRLDDLDGSVWRESRRPEHHVADSPTLEAREGSRPVTEGAGVGAVSWSTRLPPPHLDLQASNAVSRQNSPLPDLTSPTLLSSMTWLSLRSPSSPDVLQSGSMSAPPTQNERSSSYEPHVVSTSRHCNPMITATKLEGITVYQMSLGSSIILRRADTNFVNIAAIVKALGLAYPYTHNAVIVAHGSPAVVGTWVPLVTAQEMFKDQTALSTFLSDHLRDALPAAFDGILQSSPRQTYSLHHFGPSFQSTIEAKRRSLTFRLQDPPPQEADVSWEPDVCSLIDPEERLFSPQSIFALASNLPSPAASPEAAIPAELPLSPTEEEMFRVLCSDWEWETPSSGASVMGRTENVDSSGAATETKGKESRSRDRPLRRSKRVADAIANRSRTRSSKRGSRSSLS